VAAEVVAAGASAAEHGGGVVRVAVADAAGPVQLVPAAGGDPRRRTCGCPCRGGGPCRGGHASRGGRAPAVRRLGERGRGGGSDDGDEARDGVAAAVKVVEESEQEWCSVDRAVAAGEVGVGDDAPPELADEGGPREARGRGRRAPSGG
jgi:hypothetical protein